MSESDLPLLPSELAQLSINDREIALPYPQVLEAIDHLEKTNVRILGWEALLSSADGEPPYALLQGSGDLSALSKPEAAAKTRRQVQDALDDPDYHSDQPNTALYFIITVDAA